MSILNGLSGVNSETLSATKVLRDNSEVIQRLNPNGTTRTVQVLPQARHRGFIVENTGTVAAINLSVTDKDSAAVCTIGPGEWAIVHGTGTGLAGLIAGSSSSGSTLDIKGSVLAATVGSNITLAGSAPSTLDGVTLAANDRILVKDQSTGAQNGIYYVSTLGSGANGTWTRATDADTSAEVTTGLLVHVDQGTINSNRWYTLTTDGAITLGTTSLTFTLLPMATTTESVTYQVSGSSGSNLTLALDAVNAGAGEGRLTLSADDQINLDDGTANLQFDAGVVTETGMVSIDITPSGAMVLRGGGQSDFGDDTGFFRFDGAGAQTTSGLVSGSITPSAALTLTPATSSTWSLSGSSGSNLTLTIDAVNAGAGEGRLSVNADDQININDGVLDLQLDAGVVTETGMVSIDLTPSGTMVLRGGGVSTFGDDTGFFSFDGAGALSTTGLVSASLAPSGAITLTAGASSTWGVTVNSASNFTLTLNSSNAGAGQGNLDFTVKTAITATTNPTWNFGTSQATFPGNVDATNGLDVTTAALTAAAGLTLSAGTLSLTCSSGNTLIDNTVATGATTIDMGTDTSATRVALRNNSGTEHFAVQGDGTYKYSTATGLTAFAGGGQGSAIQLTMRYNEITVCATAGDSAKLPAAVAGLLVTVKNNGVAAADIFPGTSDSINTLAADAAIRLPQGCAMTFHAVDATIWEVQSRTAIDLISVAAGTAHTGSTDEAVLASRTIQASRLTAGTKCRVSWAARVTADAGATTLTGRLRLGATTLTGTELCITAAVDTGAGHYFSGEFEFVSRAAPGAAVAITGWGHTYLGAVGASGAAAVSQALVPTNFATNAALLLEVTGDWSAADGNSVQMEFFEVSFPNG